ncbi:hypothetical protein HIM_04498 [Hirsutella minnesotensis 3608]|uniref:Cytoplasmic tRNA 2-thiolation protein 2 n=1 Tax=Hirsutella minnesotensis 3608 TaxID=1043627 RepID=A0A0F8A1A4_9HYPO|nr:hypothetical protein HIM_04498 [Hirsutella minnesotensis 3608]
MCRNCFVDYVQGKAGKRLGALARDTRTSARPAPRKYVAGLSFGPSSTAMASVLDASARFHTSRKASPAFDAVLVHVDTNLSQNSPAENAPAQERLARFRERFPNLSFEYVPLSRVLGAKCMNWPALVGVEAIGSGDGEQARLLQGFLDSLPSTTSRADMTRLLVRNLLLDMALERSSSALLLGHSTTALASLTLSEVANGRGFTIPWQVNDGLYKFCLYEQASDPSLRPEPTWVEMPIYYPLREVFRNEIMLYLDLAPVLRDLVCDDDAAASSIVSHKDLSLEEVIRKYFDSVEGPYSGIVANVVRTTGKLDRATAHIGCEICGVALDEQGDSRWAGELGDSVTTRDGSARLCYGCKRTVNG